MLYKWHQTKNLEYRFYKLLWNFWDVVVLQWQPSTLLFTLLTLARKTSHHYTHFYNYCFNCTEIHKNVLTELQLCLWTNSKCNKNTTPDLTDWPPIILLCTTGHILPLTAHNVLCKAVGEKKNAVCLKNNWINLCRSAVLKKMWLHRLTEKRDWMVLRARAWKKWELWVSYEESCNGPWANIACRGVKAHKHCELYVVLAGSRLFKAKLIAF